MTPTPTQIAEWKWQAADAWIIDDCFKSPYPKQHYVGGYLRAKTEQATEIAALKAQIAEIMPLAKFGAMVLQAARDIDSSFLDVDGFDIETYAARANVVQEITATEPCGESCACAGIIGQAGFPSLCIRTTENIEATITKLLKD
jgi:hypothetical protein